MTNKWHEGFSTKHQTDYWRTISYNVTRDSNRRGANGLDWHSVMQKMCVRNDNGSRGLRALCCHRCWCDREMCLSITTKIRDHPVEGYIGISHSPTYKLTLIMESSTFQRNSLFMRCSSDAITWSLSVKLKRDERNKKRTQVGVLNLDCRFRSWCR